MGGGIFINYRGEDSDTTAALIDRELSARFGNDQIFLDSRSIHAGSDFVQELLGRLRTCSVLVVVIGPRWLTLTDATGQRRIDDPQDWIRREIAEAFTLGLRVVPVLSDDVQLPTTVDLPDDIAGLSRRQYVPLRRRYTSHDLAYLAEQIIKADPELAKIAGRRQSSIGGLPRQLPAAAAHFAGRIAELTMLTRLLHGSTGTGRTVVISAIGGTAGVGKTALAVHWAHQAADQFPDGQLYVNLRGFDPSGQVMAPAEAVRRFLDAMQVPSERIPVDLDAQAALYRSQLAGKRMLVVLDNARDTAQVRPLLPGSPTCLVLVTSRNQLIGLIAADGAHPVTLDLLTDDEAHQLLARRLGAEQVAAEPAAAAEIICRCARLPLALALVAARAALQPHLEMHRLADELRDAGHRWEMFTGDEPTTDLQTVFSWSYQALTPPAARLFRLLGLHPGPDIGAPAAISLAGVTPNAVRPLLAELTRASLLTEPTLGRYTFHDLLRAYTTKLVHSIDTDEQRHAATGRILDHYLHTADHAARLLNPAADPVPLADPRAGVTSEQLSDHTQALDWFAEERPVLLAAIDHAATAGFDTHTWQLTRTLWSFLGRSGHRHDRVVAGRTAIAAVHRLADPAEQIRAHRDLATAYIQLGYFNNAHIHLGKALGLATQIGDRTRQALTHYTLGYLWERKEDYPQALDHARRALELYQAAGNQRGQAHTLNALGWAHALLGEYQQALTACQQALALHRGLNDRHGQADTWDSLGYAHHHLGQHTQAIASYRQALALYRDLGHRYYEAATLARLGDAHHTTGDHQAARDVWQQALIILQDLHHPDAEGVRAKLATEQ